MDVTRYRNLIEEAEDSVEYWMDVPIMEFTGDLVRLMGDKVSRSELARRIDSSRQYVTKVLGGNANFTLATMTKLAMAVGGVVHVHIAPQEATTRWFDWYETVGMPSFATGEDHRPLQSEGIPREENVPCVSDQSRHPTRPQTMFPWSSDQLSRGGALQA